MHRVTMRMVAVELDDNGGSRGTLSEKMSAHEQWLRSVAYY